MIKGTKNGSRYEYKYERMRKEKTQKLFVLFSFYPCLHNEAGRAINVSISIALQIQPLLFITVKYTIIDT